MGGCNDEISPRAIRRERCWFTIRCRLAARGLNPRAADGGVCSVRTTARNSQHAALLLQYTAQLRRLPQSRLESRVPPRPLACGW